MADVAYFLTFAVLVADLVVTPMLATWHDTPDDGACS